MAPLLPEPVSPRDILNRLAQSVTRVAYTSDNEAHSQPTRTLSELASSVLLPRQAATTTVVSESGGGGGKVVLSGGAIAGIVIGSILGFLLILWLIRSCTNFGRTSDWGETFEPDHEKPVPVTSRHHRQGSYPYHQEVHRSRSRQHGHGHSHSHSHSHSRHSHSPRRSVEVRPVYYEGRARGRSPKAPPPVVLDGRDLRRSSGSRSYRY
ncbi:hypothetical protein SLS62_000926 [Diatrype stigma]|uniref:Uncharacterized protein n=1 Tax=Diatrype stigma TaxID=117547 RepID=A0AAN9V2J1_9PEZI